MRRWMLPIIFLCLSTVACALTGGDSPTQSTPIATIFSTPTAQVLLTSTPTITSTSQPTQAPQSNSGNNQAQVILPPTVINCSPRTDWPTYAVKSGDTLGVIATSHNTTIQELTRANCLPNPDSIVVGQSLRVPTTTGTTTGGSTTTGTTTGGGTTTSGTTTGGGTTSSDNRTPKFSGGVTVRPTTLINGTLVTAQAAISLDAGVVNDADRVTYYAGLSANDTTPVSVGADDDPFDGTGITYSFNEFDDLLYFWAVAQNEFGSSKTAAVAVRYDPVGGGASNTGIIPNPFIGYDPAQTIYTVQYGATLTLSWPGAPTGASRIDFYLTPSGGASVLIGTDSNAGDGAAIGWAVPEWVLAQLSAVAAFSDGRTQNSLGVNIYSEGVGVRPSD